MPWLRSLLVLLWPILILSIVVLAPEVPAAGGKTKEKVSVGGGLDSNAQRAEIIRLLRSIDTRLQQLVENRQ
jgi:hypothetical protein